MKILLLRLLALQQQQLHPAGGVTSAYLSPSDYRLIGGTGALVKMGGEPAGRVVNASASLHGSIDALRTTLRAVVLEAEDDAAQMLDVARGHADQMSPVPEREHLNALVDGLILEIIEARLRWARDAERRIADWDATTASDERAEEARQLWSDYERRLTALLADREG